MEPKKVEQDIALEEASPFTEISEEVDKSLEECKEVGHDKLFEVSPLVEDISHHGTLFFIVSRIFSCRRGVLEMKTLIFFKFILPTISTCA